jgi:hypothetical protein
VIQVEVPGIGIVEFPDGMSDAQISDAIKKSMGKPSKPEIGRGEAFMVAAGKKTDSILDGITQLYLGARGEDKALGGLKQNVDEKNALYAPLKAQYPIVTGLGEALPAMAGGGSMLGNVAASAIPEALAYGSASERAKNAGVAGAGAMLGTWVGNAVGRVLKPGGPGTQAISPEARAAADRLGVQLSPGEISQNPAMQGFENYLRRSPGSSGAMQARDLANKAAINKAAAGAVGQNADNVGESVLAAAKANIGSEFTRLQSVTKPDVSNDLLSAAIKLDVANAEKGAFRNAEVDKLVDKALDLAAQGKLTGKAYKEIRSEISARSVEATDSVVANAYREIRSALDSAAKASLSKADQEAWDLSRQQWHAYKILTKGNVVEDGSVSAARLASKVRNQGDGLRTGAQGPLYDIARIGESVKGVPNPTSGQLTQQMMYGNPFSGIPLVVGNKAAQSVYTNPLVQKYLANGLLDIGPNGQLVLESFARPAGLLGVRQYLGAE